MVPASEGGERLGDEEVLLRRIWLDDLHGDDVDPESINLPDPSFNRLSGCSPQSMTQNGSGVARLRLGDVPKTHSLPPDTSRNPPPRVIYDLGGFAVPLPDNAAHAEIRISRQGSAYDKTHKPSSKALRLQIKAAIAGAMRVDPVAVPTSNAIA